MTTSDLITQAEVITPTITQFCHHIWQLNAKVLHIESDEDKTYLITDVTPFHPVSHIWPDHPADQGFVTVGDVQYPVEDCLVGTIE